MRKFTMVQEEDSYESWKMRKEEQKQKNMTEKEVK